MQLQLLAVALQFCVVVGIWSVWVLEWQLALVNCVIVVFGYRWLRRTHARRRGSSDLPAPSLIPAALQRFLKGRLPPLPSRSTTSKATLDSTAARRIALSSSSSLRSSKGCDGYRKKNSVAGDTKTVAHPQLAAAFLSAAADTRSLQPEKKTKPLQQTEGLRQRRVGDSTSLVAARSAADASALPETKSTAQIAAVASSAKPSGTKPAASASSGQRKREPHVASVALSGGASLVEAEVAARRAEKELLRMLQTEANAKASRSSRQREAVSSLAAPPASAAALAPAAGVAATTTAAAAVPQKASSCAEKPEKAVPAGCDSKLRDESVQKSPTNNKKKAPPPPTVTNKEKENNRRRQLAKAALLAAPGEPKVDFATNTSVSKEDKLAAMLDAVAKSNSLNGRPSSICSAATTSCSSSPSPATSPASVVGTETDADPQDLAAASRGSDASCSRGARGHGDSESAGDGWSVESSLDTRDAREAREDADSVDGESGDWSRRMEAAYDGRGPCTLDDYFSYAYGSSQVPVQDALPPFAHTSLESCVGLPQQDFVSKVMHAIPPPPPPPPPPPLVEHRQTSQEGTNLAEELRALFPSATIHLASPSPPTPVAANLPPPPLAPAPLPVAPVSLAAAVLGSQSGPVPSRPVPSRRVLSGPVPSGPIRGNFCRWDGVDAPHEAMLPRLGPAPVSRSQFGPSDRRCPGREAQSLSAEVLFKLPAASLGPPPSGAPLVSQVEACSKASSWRDRLRSQGDVHLEEVEAAFRRRELPPQAEQMYGAASPTAPLPALSPELHMQTCSDLRWHGDHGALFSATGPAVGAPPSFIAEEMWPGEPLYGASAAVARGVEAENPDMPWQAYLAEPTSYMEAMPMDGPYGTEQISAQMHAAAVPMYCGLNRDQLAAQLQAAAPCHYED